MPVPYPNNLEELADCFETYAADQEACLRVVKSKRGRAVCLIKAETWRDAAACVRSLAEVVCHG